MEFTITFPGGLKVEADNGRHRILTDQHPDSGGEGSAPEPYTLFLASIGTCAGIYVLRFCQAHNLPTEGVYLFERSHWDEARKRLARVELEVRVPPTFPEHYRDALARSANLCAVKKALFDPPEFDVRTVVTSPNPG